MLEGGPPLKELGSLMTRIQLGKHLPRDTGSLGKGLYEARLSYVGNEYRLYYALGPQQEHVLLGLAFHQKGSQGAQDRVIDLARKRLADWLRRI
ncbi:type II toxin-antitoxin system RelE/ParE family toxin [Streptosporangium sp. NPDC087985]|uniref:type II toxin-antitoxin system RelE/ParE family toxin n=1 Tax=Streptosporangium sp. NPDC087985 TaxID=3366196 RepID=UPI00380AFBA4